MHHQWHEGGTTPGTQAFQITYLFFNILQLVSQTSALFLLAESCAVSSLHAADLLFDIFQGLLFCRGGKADKIKDRMQKGSSCPHKN